MTGSAEKFLKILYLICKKFDPFLAMTLCFYYYIGRNFDNFLRIKKNQNQIRTLIENHNISDKSRHFYFVTFREMSGRITVLHRRVFRIPKSESLSFFVLNPNPMIFIINPDPNPEFYI